VTFEIKKLGVIQRKLVHGSKLRIRGIVVLKIHAEQAPNLEAGMSNHGPKKSANFLLHTHHLHFTHSAIVCGGRAPCPSALHPINELTSNSYIHYTTKNLQFTSLNFSKKNLFNSINYNIGRGKISTPQLK
jgi:hypothetical protein